MRFRSTGDRDRSCHRKQRYPNSAAAYAALKRTAVAKGDLTLVVYQCRHCKGFHVGHPPRSVRKRLRTQRLLQLIDRANHPKPQPDHRSSDR